MSRVSMLAAMLLVTAAVAAPAAAQPQAAGKPAAAPAKPAEAAAAPVQPKPKPPKPPQVIKVYFNAGTNELSDAARAVVDGALKKIEQDPYTNVAIEGHYDTSLPPPKALDMSRRNANAVADYLKSHGVEAKRLQVSGVGSTALAVPTAQGEKEPLNRAVIITITPRKKTNAEADAEYAAAMEVYQRKMKAHDNQVKQFHQAQAQFRSDKAAKTKAARDAKAQYRQAQSQYRQVKAQADAARAQWRQRVAECKAGKVSACGG